ncbi:hypothetical protein ACYULU_05355 [Breznakiellaceae bacterium SP9]
MKFAGFADTDWSLNLTFDRDKEEINHKEHEGREAASLCVLRALGA